MELEAIVVPYLDAAYTLARYLTRNDADAQDVVQDAALRAVKYVSGFRGTTAADARAWFLAIVRNTAYSARQRGGGDSLIEFNEDLHSDAEMQSDPVAGVDLHKALDALPFEFREVIVLRELEGLSYKDIGEVTGVPIGTVMSRLARARKRLQQALAAPSEERV